MLLVKKNFKSATLAKLKNCQNGTFEPVHRGAFCQFSFRLIYYYDNNKSTGKETGKTHLCALFYDLTRDSIANNFIRFVVAADSCNPWFLKFIMLTIWFGILLSHSEPKTTLVQKYATQCTEVRFASFLSGGFIIAIVVNQTKRKLAKRTSVHCGNIVIINVDMYD